MQHAAVGVQFITFEEHVNDVFKVSLRGSRIERGKLFKCCKELIFRKYNVAVFFLTGFSEGMWMWLQTLMIGVLRSKEEQYCLNFSLFFLGKILLACLPALIYRWRFSMFGWALYSLKNKLLDLINSSHLLSPKRQVVFLIFCCSYVCWYWQLHTDWNVSQ